MNLNKQYLLLEYLISSEDTFSLTQNIIEPSYFDPSLRNAVKWIKSYHQQYNALPSPSQIYAETEVDLKFTPLEKDKLEYCTREIEKFCQQRSAEEGIIKATLMIKDGHPDGIVEVMQKALDVSIKKDIGLSYFDSPHERLEDMLLEPARTSVGFGPDFDKAIGGGIVKPEMLMFLANSGGGKSIALANVAINFVQRGYHVVYISLELSVELISRRFDQMFTGYDNFNWRDNYEEIASGLIKIGKTSGSLHITRFPAGTNCNELRAYIKDYALQLKRVPDMIIVDYLDELGTNAGNEPNISEKDKNTSRELNELGFYFNSWVVTASQQNRGAIDAVEKTQAHTGGGIGKLNKVDVAASVILTPSMKQQGVIGFTFTKVRSGEGAGETVMTGWDSRKLRILNNGYDKDDPIIDTYSNNTKQSNQNQQKPSKRVPDRPTSTNVDLLSLIEKHSSKKS